MKRGGELIYAGPLGHNSCELIEFFEVGSHLLPSIPFPKFEVCHDLYRDIMKLTSENIMHALNRLLTEYLRSKTDATPPHGCST